MDLLKKILYRIRHNRICVRMYFAFDIDGTVFDCGGIIVDAYRRAIPLFSRETGIELDLPSRESLIAVMGQTVEGFFPPLFPSLDRAMYPVLDRFCTAELVSDIRAGKGIIYDGAAEVFETVALRGHGILIASNGQYDYITAILEAHGLDRYLAAPVCTVDFSSIRTKGEILSFYRAELAIENSLVMVGDRRSDLAAAKENGAYFIGCAFGHAGDTEVCGADYIAHSYGDISTHIGTIPGF
jgi:phosphoglycolate phosphatase